LISRDALSHRLALMGASGKKLLGHGQRRKSTSPAASVADGRFGSPPHPICARVGQKYWPLAGHRRRAFVVRSVDGDGVVKALRVDGNKERLTIAAERITAIKADGRGRYYSFLAWVPRRYRTWAVVMSVLEEQAILVLPEWHPGRPIHLPARLLPQDARVSGAWLSLKADLSVVAGGQLNPADLVGCEDPGEGQCPRPTWQPAG
jgi:hypothetical protein